MFYGCTSLTTVPKLSATTLTKGCYQYMFNGSKNLNYVKCLAKNFVSNALFVWLKDVAPTGTFVKPAGVSYTVGNSGIPDGWNVEILTQ